MSSVSGQINEIKENLTATLRAMVGDESLSVDFIDGVKDDFFVWNHNLLSKQGVKLPKIDPAYSQQHQHLEHFQHCHPTFVAGSANFSAITHFRAASDMAACYLLFHNKENQLPNDFSLEEVKILENFERIRLIINIASQYRGAMQNILTKIEFDIGSGFGDLSLVLLKNIIPHHIGLKTSAAANDVEINLSKKVTQAILALEKYISDQIEFTAAMHEIIEMLRREQELEEQEKQNENANSSNKEDTKQNSIEDPANMNEENIESDKGRKIDADLEGDEQKNEPEKEQKKEPNLADFKEDDLEGDDAVKSDGSSANNEGIEFKNPYKVYSSKFDEVVFPQKMVSKNDLELLRDQLDLKMTKLQGISKKMSLKLKRKLLSKRHAFVEHDSSRGIFDRKKMTQLVINPEMEDVWVNTKTHEYQDTALTILLDNSGSMRGGPIVMSAMACEIIADILEKFSVKTEIIGFTTADWKGGRARKLWESSGREKNPGRLNELRHVIYKHFNQSFKKSKVNLGMMLKEGVLKENIDGEALLFARARLLQQSEKRKILMVISDGTPVDDSTSSANASLGNDSDLLTDHLHHVINKIEKNSQIEIVGVGIGHSTDDFYRNSIAIKNLDDLGDVMIEKIASLL